MKIFSPSEQLRNSILAEKTYATERKQRRQEIIALKRHRRVAIGPYAVLHFENFTTMLYQIQEMLWIEKGGAEQLEDELRAYAPLVPSGRELVATMMLEIDDKALRQIVLRQLGNIDSSVYMQIEETKIMGRPEQDGERNTQEGRTSSVHFLRFPLTKSQAAAISSSTSEVKIGIAHPHYNFRIVLTREQKQALSRDVN